MRGVRKRATVVAVSSGDREFSDVPNGSDGERRVESNPDDPSRVTPSSTYEALIVEQLEALLRAHEEDACRSFSVIKLLRPLMYLHLGIPIGITFAMLLVSCAKRPNAQTVWCFVLLVVMHALYAAFQVYVYWERVNEIRVRTANVMGEVVQRWKQRIAHMSAMPRQTAEDRRIIFLESLAVLPCSAFRFIAVVETATSRLKHMLKCLAIRRCERLNEATLRVSRYLEPTSICKLVDIMRITLEGDAIVLKPLTDRVRPPRHPNLLLMSNRPEDEKDDTTDSSDHEMDSRTALGGGNSISVPNHMEYFVQRVFMILWLLGMVVTVISGSLFYGFGGQPLDEVVLLNPAVALIGLLPLNAILMHRVLVLYANVYLDQLFCYLVSKRTHSVEDRLPRFSFRETLLNTIRVVVRSGASKGVRHPLCFARSMVESLGMATVVALLDSGGILTDMVLLPVVVLFIKEPPGMMDSSTSSDDADDSGYPPDCLATSGFGGAEGGEGAHGTGVQPAGNRSNADRNREMKRQVRRKKLHEQRFVEVRLTHSSLEDLAVQFAEARERVMYERNINPLCLCILLHSTAPMPQNLETWTEPFRFCDRTVRWVRSLHWLTRAANFDGAVTSHFRILARIFMIDNKAVTGYRNSFPEQVCALLVEDGEQQLHVFSIGTPYLLVERCCSSHWTGTSVGELDSEARAEVTYMGKHQWEDGQSLETVAASHRVLPERYRKYVNTLAPLPPGQYHEFFFRNGREVTSMTARHKKSGAAPEPQSRKSFTAAPNHSSGDAAAGPGRQSTVSSLSTPLVTSDEEALWGFGGRGRGSWIRTSSSGAAAPRSRSAPLLSQPNLWPRKSVKRANSLGAVPSGSMGHFEEDDCLTAKTFVRLMMASSHTFLGMVGVQDSVRPDVVNCISELDEAGVRCMLFSPENERRTKSFGARLGLETDWNCCISLREGAVALDPYSIRAQLPFGIKSIRKHILYVDPIPLQVSLFSHSRGVATRAMLSILQDNHEVVVSVGSVFNHGNVRSFLQADFAIGVLPTRRGSVADKEVALGHWPIIEPPDFRFTQSLNRDLPLYENVAELIGCSCTIRAPPTTSVLPIVTTLIRQSRLRLSGISNCVQFILHTNALIVIVNVVALVVGAPLLISPTATLFELNVIIPILSLSCTYNAYSGIDPMKTMPSRHNFFVRLAIFRHNTILFLLRYGPSAAALLVLGITCGERLCAVDYFRLSQHTTSNCMLATRGYVALTLNYWMMIHCWTHMSRHHRVSLNFSLQTVHGRRPMYLYQSYRFVLVSFFATTLSIIFVAIDTRDWDTIKDMFFPSVPHFIVSLLFPILIYGLDIPIKRWREKRSSTMQKFRKLSFETRLGMHSPRGDYEPEGVTYTGGATVSAEELIDYSDDCPSPRSPSPAHGPPRAAGGPATDVVVSLGDGDGHDDGRPNSKVHDEESAANANASFHRSGNHHSVIGASTAARRPALGIRVRKYLSEVVFRFTSMQRGRLELNCVCCDHVGGNFAAYLTSTAV